MHMKEDHMKNGQIKPGYNIQIGVDVSSERADQLTFIPFLDNLKKIYLKNLKILQLTLDSKMKAAMAVHTKINVLKLKIIRDFMYLKIFLRNAMNLLKIFQRPKGKF